MNPRFCSVLLCGFLKRLYDYRLLLQVLRLLGIVLGFCVRYNFPLGISVAPSLFKVSDFSVWASATAM
jgi:hypothetical protein